MHTPLQIYCQFAGWQGGTIHQAYDDFKSRDKKSQDKLCNMLMKAIDNNELDLDGMKLATEFFKLRTSHLAN